MKRTAQLIAGILLIGATAALALEPVNARRGVAIHSYDAVAYFDGEARRGDAKYSHVWNGVTWHFVDEANRDRFAASPEDYAPRYGGYCAYAVSKGSTADVDPEAWTVVDGKLYLNYSKSVRTKWRQDIPGNIAKADVNWPKLLAR